MLQCMLAVEPIRLQVVPRYHQKRRYFILEVHGVEVGLYSEAAEALETMEELASALTASGRVVVVPQLQHP